MLDHPGLPAEGAFVTVEVEAEVGRSNGSFDEVPMQGRRTYGNFKRRKKFDDGGGGEDEANNEEEDEEERKIMEEAFASKAQKKLREGVNPDRVNLKGLKGQLSGFKKKDRGHEGKKHESKKNRMWEASGASER